MVITGNIFITPGFSYNPRSIFPTLRDFCAIPLQNPNPPRFWPYPLVILGFSYVSGFISRNQGVILSSRDRKSTLLFAWIVWIDVSGYGYVFRIFSGFC